MIHIHEYHQDTAGIYHCAFCNSILVIVEQGKSADDRKSKNEQA